MRNKLYAGFQSERLEVDVTWLQRLVRRLLMVDVEVAAVLGTTTVTPRRLLELKVGDIITLQQDATEPMRIKLEQIDKFRGMAGLSKGSKAVKITKKISGIDGDR